MKLLGRTRQRKANHHLNGVRIRWEKDRYRITGLNTWHSYWRDPYHLLLTMPWGWFLALMVISFFAFNSLFAIAYLIGENNIAHARPGSFLDAFFFSVQTIASIGYGAMYPVTVYAHILVTLEALAGLMAIAIGTGLAFARFSRPTARVIFSKTVAIAPYNGVPMLMLRAANQRGNQILEAELRAYLLRDEISTEGEFMRRFYELKLLRSRTASFSITWTVMHPIDENSPLFGVSREALIKTNAQIEVSLSGLDETVSSTIHARHSYGMSDIHWNARFVDIIRQTPEGDRYIDFARFHDVRAIAPSE